MTNFKMPTPEELKELIRDLKPNFDSLKLRGHIPSSTDLSGWETSLTNPQHHNPQQFCYLVHAIKNQMGPESLLQKLFLLDQMKRDKDIQYKPIDLLQEPQRIAERAIICTSLIDQAHRATWTAGGYILRVPLDNILKTASEDIGTLFHKGQDTAQTLYQERDTKGIASLDEVLQRTNPLFYNEIVLTGTGRTGKKVEIAGIFLKVLPNGEYVEEDLARELQRIHWQINKPIIKIEEAIMTYADTKPEIFNTKTLGVSRGGIRYIFDSENNLFTIYEYGGYKMYRMTPYERQTFLAITEFYLIGNPNPEMEQLLAKAEQVPDQELEQKIAQQRAYQEQKRNPFGKKKFNEYVPLNPVSDKFSTLEEYTKK